MSDVVTKFHKAIGYKSWKEIVDTASRKKTAITNIESVTSKDGILI